MSGWGIAETAPVIEKIKAESADYLRGLNACGEITWSVYDEAFDFYMELISRAYEQGKQDAQPEFAKDTNVPSSCSEIPNSSDSVPSAQPEYEPVTVEDFAKTMTENTIYSFMAWHGEALKLMERQGFVICKKTTR